MCLLALKLLIVFGPIERGVSIGSKALGCLGMSCVYNVSDSDKEDISLVWYLDDIYGR